MSRETRGKVRSNAPSVKPVEKIEVSESHIGIRLAATAVLLLVGVVGLAYAFMLFVTPKADWEEIEVNSAADTNVAGEFVLRYHLGQERSATTERREIVLNYTEAAVIAYRQFSVDEHFEDMPNLYDINHSLNRELTIEEPLYSALKQILAAGNRNIYLGAAYSIYENIFSVTDDSELYAYDPFVSQEMRDVFENLASFARDPKQIDLELLGDGKVCLHISQEYLDYAKSYGIDTFLDFAWMRNAFIIDFIADTLKEKGFTYGYITSYDGFVRNLDDRNQEEYSYQFYHLIDGKAYPAAEMTYSGTFASVNLRAYPVGEKDFRRFYVTNSGEIRTPYLTLADGLPHTSLEELTVYSYDPGDNCAKLLLETMPVYLSDSFSKDSLPDNPYGGAAWFEGNTLKFTETDLSLSNLYDNGSVSFSAELAK